MAAADGAITAIEVSRVLGIYTANAAYLRSMRVDAARIDLDGNPTGTVSSEHSEGARARLMAREKVKAVNKTTQQKEPPPKRLSLADLNAAAVARRKAAAA